MKSLHTKDLFGNVVVLPSVGDKVIVDKEYIYTITQVVPNRDIAIIASITMKGSGSEKETGYYDYLMHPKVK